MRGIGGRNRLASALHLLALAAVLPSFGYAQEAPAPQDPPQETPTAQESPTDQGLGFNTFNAVDGAASDTLANVGGMHGMELIRLRPGTSRVPLRRAHLIAHSERLDLDGRVLTPGADYTIDHAAGLVVLNVPAEGGNLRASYRYDAAHRLIGIQDNLGNRVSYTLDPAGNRLKETLTDPNGALARQIGREFDALSRLQRETWGAQP